MQVDAGNGRTVPMNGSANSAIPAGIVLTGGRSLVSHAALGASNLSRFSKSRMRTHGSRIVPMLLMALVTTISLAGQDSTMMTPAALRPAGCHQHGAKPPASTPVSYGCCQQGHDPAIPQSSFVSHRAPSRLVSTLSSLNPPFAAPRPGSLQILTISSPDPPHTVPLRV